MKTLTLLSLICLCIQLNLMGQPQMDYPETVDFGRVLENTDPYRKVTIRNKGNEPLKITNARDKMNWGSSIVVTFPKEPIFPGDSAVLSIRRDTRKIGAFTSDILISLFGGGKKTLTISGEVLTDKGKMFGEILFALNKYPRAIEEFTKSINIKPDNTKALLFRAYSYEMTQQQEKALVDYNTIIQLDPKNAKAYYGRGATKSIMGPEHYQASMADFTKAIALAPDYTSAYYSRGVLKNILKDYRGSIEDFNTAIKLNGKKAGFYLSRGKSKYSIGSKAGACSDFRKAKELGEPKAATFVEKYCN